MIQEIVDALAARIGLPVAVDDRRYRSVAYSAHVGETDEVRRASILAREAPATAREYVETLGVARAEGPVAVAARPDLGLSARLCFPIRFDAVLTGYLWLFDGPQARSPATAQAVQDCLGELGAELYRGLRLADSGRFREAECVEALVRSDTDLDVAALGVVAGGLASASRYVVLVAVSGPGAATATPNEREVGFRIAVERLRRGMRPRQMMATVTADDVVIVLGLEGEDLTRWATALRAAVSEHLDAADAGGVVVGAGAPRSRLVELREAYREAVVATRVAGTVGPIAVWDRLGAYRVLAELLEDREPLALLPRSVVRLLADPDAGTLVRTAEVYLEHAGDVQASAAALFLHRSSLYNRLHRIEEVSGIDLRDGDHRLELHLGIRLWRLASDAGRATEHPGDAPPLADRSLEVAS